MLRRQFPRVHASLRVEAVNTYSLLYRWAGTRPALMPAMVAGHLDVVPIDPSTEHLWTQPPFGGVVADGLIWGRGTLDDKVREAGGGRREAGVGEAGDGHGSAAVGEEKGGHWATFLVRPSGGACWCRNA